MSKEFKLQDSKSLNPS
jgi:ubiquinone/menaquinone biosynthesis C-methylase UbiE